MKPAQETVQQSTFRDFIIEASAVQMGSQWRPQFRVLRGKRKTSWCTPRVSAFANSALAMEAAVQYATREIRRGWGSCYA